MTTPHCHLLQAGDIQAIVADASRDRVGGTQYCGLWSLTSRHRPFNAFGTPQWLRFFCSPSNAGASLLPGRTCPAWDFEWVLPAAAYEVGRACRLRVRLAYKPFLSDDDIAAQARAARPWLDA